MRNSQVSPNLDSKSISVIENNGEILRFLQNLQDLRGNSLKLVETEEEGGDFVNVLAKIESVDTFL